MKLFFSVLLFLTFSQKGSAQLVGTKSFKDIDIDYIQVTAFGRVLSTKFFIEIDYGQKIAFMASNERLKNEDGSDFDFNSAVDALNFM